MACEPSWRRSLEPPPAGSPTALASWGGGTAVYVGWRESTIDADLSSDDHAVFRDAQNIKDRLQLNIEFVRPEDFVPPLRGSNDRQDAENFVRSGMVEPERFRSLVQGIPDRSYAEYPALSRRAVLDAVEDFLERSPE